MCLPECIEGMAQTSSKRYILPFLCYHFICHILEATKDKHLGFVLLKQVKLYRSAVPCSANRVTTYAE